MEGHARVGGPRLVRKCRFLNQSKGGIDRLGHLDAATISAKRKSWCDTIWSVAQIGNFVISRVGVVVTIKRPGRKKIEVPPEQSITLRRVYAACR
jgi:hypothetical protein